MLRDIAKGREARIEFVEKDGVEDRDADLVQGPDQARRPRSSSSTPRSPALVGRARRRPTLRADRLAAAAALPGRHDPDAINLPYPAFDKFVDRLPTDKAKRIVFFCQGITCMMSPNSLRRAEGMGYTNVKVYREGVPGVDAEERRRDRRPAPQGRVDRQGHPARARSTCARPRPSRATASSPARSRAGVAGARRRSATLRPTRSSRRRSWSTTPTTATPRCTRRSTITGPG